MHRRLLALALLAGLSLAGCAPEGPTFEIVSGSENRILQPIVDEFCRDKRAICTVRYAGSLDIGLSLKPGADPGADAVWPAAGLWIDLFDTGRRVRDLKSIAQTPVVLGVRRSKAEELGWVDRPVAMADVLEAVRSGRLGFLMTSATQSNSGAAAYLAMLSAAVGRDDVVTEADLDDPRVRAEVADLLKGVVRSAGSSGWLAELYLAARDKGVVYDAMWNYEAVLKETNDGLAATGGEPLYAIYPVDGVAIADSPLGFVDRGRGPEVAAFFDELQAHLSSPEIQARIAETGRRLPFGGPTAQPEPAWNFDPTRLVTAIRTPDPAVIAKALTLYQETLRRPSLTALCLDYSGSMSGDGERDLEAGLDFLFSPDTAADLLVQWTPKDRILLLPFNHGVIARYEGSGEPAEQERLKAAIRSHQAEGGTDMYACGLAALEAMAPDLASGQYLPAIVLMTDGRSDGDRGAFWDRWRAAGGDVPVFGITFGNAERAQLDEIARDTDARVFDGAKDLGEAFRATRGYN